MIRRSLYRSICQTVNTSIKSCSYGTQNDERTNRQRFLRQSQGLRAFRPSELPENPTIILFPGQGAQFVGMAKSLSEIPAAKELFDIASEILK